jgi:precorrin-6B methylase 1
VSCRDRRTPAQVAAVLAANGWGRSELIVPEQLGGQAERAAARQSEERRFLALYDGVHGSEVK